MACEKILVHDIFQRISEKSCKSLGNKSCKGDKFLSNNFLIWCHFKFPNPVKLLATEEKSISTALLQPGNRRVGLHRFGPAQRSKLKTWKTQPACNRTADGLRLCSAKSRLRTWWNQCQFAQSQPTNLPCWAAVEGVSLRFNMFKYNFEEHWIRTNCKRNPR